MGKISLFEISHEHIEIMEIIEENEGILDEQIELALQINQVEFKQKALSYVHVIKFCESELERAKEAESQLNQFKKRKQAVIERLKENLEFALKLFGPIETGFFKLTLRKSEQVVIEDEKVIPCDFIQEKIIRSPDKIKIKRALQNDVLVPGALLRTNHNLQIK